MMVWLLLLAVQLCQAVELKPFALTEPSWPHIEHKLKPTELWGPDIKAPYPTNEWWQDVVLEQGKNPVFNRPYSLTFHDNGPLVGMPPKLIAANGHFIAKWWRDGVTVGFADESTGHQVISYDDMGATIQYNFHKGRVTVPALHGSPYLTAIYKDQHPVIKFISNDIFSVNGVVGGGIVKGTNFLVKTLSGQIWIVYTMSTTTFTWDNRTLTGDAPTTVRLAANPWVMNVKDSKPILDKYAKCIPLGGKVELDVDDKHAATTIDWDYKGCPPLILALPHHQDVLSHLKHTYTNLHYDGILGNMIGVVAATWTWKQKLVDVGFKGLTPIAADKKEDIIEQLKKDLLFTGMAPDTYSFGKGVCRIARLALIAEELKQPDLVEKANSIMYDAFAPWMIGEGLDKVMYDTVWYGTPPKKGLDDWHEDFGAGWYNDHHFHYGYWLYAASVLAKNNKTWAEETKEKFVALARDIANPSPKDPWFPVWRHFDWYAGHSWASGLMAFTDGRNQESSSECLNAWYGLMLYGKAIGDKNIQRTGATLLAHEMRAAKKYWHSTSDSSVYPEGFSQNKGVGMIWGDKVDYNTWFGAGVVYALGINMMPFTPLSEIYLDQHWMGEALPILNKALAVGYNDDWTAIVYMAGAIVDPAKYWEKLKKLGHFDDGNSRTNAMWWMASRPPFNPKKRSTIILDDSPDPSAPAGSEDSGASGIFKTIVSTVVGLGLLMGIAAFGYKLLPKVRGLRSSPSEEEQGLMGDNPVYGL